MVFDKAILARYQGGTYLAQVAGAGRYRASSTAGPRQAAEALVAKHYGPDRLESLRRVDRDDPALDRLQVDPARRQKAEMIFLFRPTMPSKSTTQTALAKSETVSDLTTRTSGGAVAAISQIPLDRLREIINQGHATIEQQAEQSRILSRLAAQNAVVMGLFLKVYRQKTPHGEWESLFTSKGQIGNGFRFTVRTARNYMKLAEGALATPGLAAGSRNRILALVESGADLDTISDTVREDLAAATKGDTLRQAYLALGIIPASAKEQAEAGLEVGGNGEKPTRKGQGTDTSGDDPGADPDRSFADDAYLGLAEPTRALTRLLERGELALCETERVRDLAAIWRSFADDAETILKDRKAQA